jgi:hypothetical protein
MGKLWMKRSRSSSFKPSLLPFKITTREEIKGMPARRDLTVAFFEAKGETSLFDRPERQ